jgi:hypothetical protein
LGSISTNKVYIGVPYNFETLSKDAIIKGMTHAEKRLASIREDRRGD